ncbi:type II CAAX endopeptidase family protein [Microcoleus sp. FACHB-672]|uniref:type II CAAX endopeptidase family protein n=1 Tax=Microcoleus sp. FACHB-672 TaxID=2692825 RepID=UPI0016835EFE|nr:type II CAAX endopeptidase family protein [Microcoleus sp. FACHB-672]MBD2039910.1 CPBP family intramembrane metalloprotease [Microcoleus sp. FACHB-672]
MTIKRLLLGALTILALFLVSASLVQSWNQPQIQSRLELYQTNLILHAAEWRGDSDQAAGVENARKTLIGDDAFETALKQYQETRQSAQKSLETTQQQLELAQTAAIPPAPKPPAPENPPVKTAVQSPQQLQASIDRLDKLIDELDLRIGVLQAHKAQTEAALTTWTGIIERSSNRPIAQPFVTTAGVLRELWNSRILPDAEPQIQQNLDGWFRYQALSRLYELQESSNVLATLQAEEQEVAQQAAIKLAIIGGIPTIGFFVGVGLLIFLLAQRVVKGKESLLAQHGELSWETPWDAETIWQVLIVGFFFVGQIVVPLSLGLLNSALDINPATLDVRSKAFYILASYVLLASGGLLVIYLSVKPYLPLPESWFRFDWRGNWFLWGLGGYLVALPLVVVVSLINQRLWQGQGGSNPILPIALEGKDNVALAIFFLTASIGAPVFEELMFRGFLLPSLTRYVPVWGAIAASSLLFAIAHLNVSEVLPLATLGAVLGFIYTRSRNLLAPMLLHSLWNTGTLLSLFILGSGSK